MECKHTFRHWGQVVAELYLPMGSIQIETRLSLPGGGLWQVDNIQLNVSNLPDGKALYDYDVNILVLTGE